MLVSHLLAHIEYLDETIPLLTAEIEQRMRPFERQRELLCTIPGVAGRTAEVIVAELGPDVERFPPTVTPPAGPQSAPATTSRPASAARARPAGATLAAGGADRGR